MELPNIYLEPDQIASGTYFVPDRVLTDAELETLFNDGVGFSYPFDEDLAFTQCSWHDANGSQFGPVVFDEPEPDVVVKLPDNQQVCR